MQWETEYSMCLPLQQPFRSLPRCHYDVYCSVLQRVAVCCNVLQQHDRWHDLYDCNTLQHCNTLQLCNTLQHCNTHCNAHCNTLQKIRWHVPPWLLHTATLQHAATLQHTLQHTSFVWHDLFICVTWLIHMCDMTHSYVWHDLFTCDMTHAFEWHDSTCDIWVTWLIHTRHMSYHTMKESYHFIRVTYEWYDSHKIRWHVPSWLLHCNTHCNTATLAATHCNTCCNTLHDTRRRWIATNWWMSHVAHMNESCHTYEWVMSHIWMSHVTHMNESCHIYEWVMSHIW